MAEMEFEGRKENLVQHILPMVEVVLRKMMEIILFYNLKDH
jgi:hypothetical protein